MEKKIIKTAKELFDAEVKVSGAKYIDEVADIHYYYVENEDNAHLYMADEVNKSYDLAIFPKAYVFVKDHIFEYTEAMKGMLENDKAQTLFNNLTCGAEHEFQALYNFCYYCDFLMQNTKLAIDGRSFKDEYEEVEEEKAETKEHSKVVEDVVQDFRDALTAQKKVVWSMIKNRYIKGGKNIDMERMPEVLGCSDGDGFHVKDCGHFFSIVILEGHVRVLFRPEGDEEYERHLTYTDFSYEGLLDIFYAMA